MGFNYEPGSTFKVVAVSGGLESGLITPNTPFDIPDQIQVANRTIHDAEEHPDETLTTAEILAQSSNVGAIKIGALDGPRAVQPVGARLRLRRAHRRRTAGRGNGRGAAAERILGLLDGQPADRTGRAGHADADGHAPTRRSPTAASCARRTSSAPSTAAPQPEPAGRPRDLRRRRPLSCARCSRACSRRAAPPARSRSPAMSWRARRARPARSTRRPASTPNQRLRRLVHRLRAGGRPEAAVRGRRRRTPERLDLRRHGRRAGVRADHVLRAALPAHPAGIASGQCDSMS